MDEKEQKEYQPTEEEAKKQAFIDWQADQIIGIAEEVNNAYTEPELKVLAFRAIMQLCYKVTV